MRKTARLWPVLVLSAVAAFAAFSGRTSAAPLAAALGPQVPMAKAEGGFVGHLSVVPDHGPAGTPVKIEADSLPPDQEFTLAWRTVDGSWKVAGEEYHGREYRPIAYQIARLKSDASGHLAATFTTPEDFGFSHDIVLQQNDRLFIQAGYSVDMTVAITPASGPVGTPIRVDVRGIGWRDLESSWLLLYDNNFTGWMSAVTTAGSASFTVPATGQPGDHLLEILHGEFTFAYLNPQQNPEPGRPRFALPFTITPGEPVLPPSPEQQAQTSVRNLPAAAGTLHASQPFSGIGRPLTVSGSGFEPGRAYELSWKTLTGNRVSGGGWEESAHVVAKANADAAGELAFRFAVPDDLGGQHDFFVNDDPQQRQGSYWIAPTALPLDVAEGPVGTTFDVHLKGVGWTETANIYTVVYDNSYIGYACGFNSQGDVEIFLKATGEPGWHFIDLYPAIYKGKEAQPMNFRIPQLTYAADHPGEDLPAFHFAFEVKGSAGTRAMK